MNEFGRLLRTTIFGESHGEAVGICLQGVPAGLSLQSSDFEADLERRKGGIQKGTTPRKEEDIPLLKSGVFNGKTTGAPILILFENNNIRSTDYDQQRSFPRPGHADFVAEKKYGGFQDYRGGGHFSGRLTVALVAAGVIAKKLLQKINIHASLIEAGGINNISEGLARAIEAKDSIGGIVECKVDHLPIGLGEPFFDSVESLIAHLAFAIPAIKGIEFGDGFSSAKMFGSEHNDAIENAQGKTKTNHAGGINGGLTNGNELIFRVAVKPTSSTPQMQQSWNKETQEVAPFSVKGRHDLCIALRVPVIIEAITALVLADLMMLEQRIPRIL
ncbi:MAG: chorismate synthase [Bacteroidetes bacterium]|nr:chorismate synthase [Bacteroidota bacterium]